MLIIRMGNVGAGPSAAAAPPGRPFAIFFVLVVTIVIFGSVFSMLAGFMYLPGAAAMDGVFFSACARRSSIPCSEGVPTLPLVSIGLLSCCWCFFSLETVIDAMTTLLVLVQFIGQAVGLCVLRCRKAAAAAAATAVTTKPTDQDQLEEQVWKLGPVAFPMIVTMQLVVFLFILVSSDNWIISGNDPILDLALVFLLW